MNIICLSYLDSVKTDNGQLNLQISDGGQLDNSAIMSAFRRGAPRITQTLNADTPTNFKDADFIDWIEHCHDNNYTNPVSGGMFGTTFRGNADKRQWMTGTRNFDTQRGVFKNDFHKTIGLMCQ